MQKTNLKTALFALKHNLKRIKSKDRYTKLFVKKMNAKAFELGMTATRFVHLDGGGTSNKSTVQDLLISVVAAYRNELISSVWTNREKEILCTGAKQRAVILQSTLHTDNFTAKYKILGGKTGSWAVPTKLVSATYNLSVVAEIDGRIIAAVVANANSDYDRFGAVEELLDIANSLLQGKTGGKERLSLAMCGAVCEILPNNCRMLFSQNAELQIVPASLAKLTSLLVACDYITDPSEILTFSSRDMVGGSGNFFCEGDTITIEDAFYAALLPSSNSAMFALSREVGKRISKKSFVNKLS